MTTSLEKLKGAGIHVVSHIFDTLTNVGTTSPFGPVDFVKDHTFQWTAGTAGSAIFVRTEGSLDRVSWFDMFASGSAEITNAPTPGSTVLTTKLLNKSDFKVKYVRFNYHKIISVGPKTRGTATVNVRYLGGI